MRDKRATAEYFECFREVASRQIEELAPDVKDLDLAKRSPFVYASITDDVHREHMRLVLWAYSVGKSCFAVASCVSPMLDAFVYMKNSDREYLNEKTLSFRHDFRTSRDIFVDDLWALSLAVLFDEDRVAEVAGVVGNEGVDGVFDRLAAWRVPGRRLGGVSAWPKPYDRLLAVFEADAADRPGLMAEFLKVWYRLNRGVYWWGGHIGPKKYGGYWCFEAAAVVKVLGIDDSSFRDNEYYPVDLLPS